MTRGRRDLDLLAGTSRRLRLQAAAVDLTRTIGHVGDRIGAQEAGEARRANTCPRIA